MDNHQIDSDLSSDEATPPEETFTKKFKGYKINISLETFSCMWYKTGDVKEIRAEISKGNDLVGSMEGYLFGRCGFETDLWHDSDVVSDELQNTANTFFHRTGRLRRERWGMFSWDEIDDASVGGFLSIYMVNVEKEYRGNDLGYQAVQFLLECLKGRWTLSVVELCYWDDEIDKKHQIYQLFSRIGYSQNVYKGKDYWYLRPHAVKHKMTKEQARNLSFAILRKVPKYQLSSELRTLTILGDWRIQQQQGSSDAEVVEKICKYIRDKASDFDINQSCCLHIAAGQALPLLVQALLTEGADVNSRGLHGETALHAACNTSNVDCIRKILNHPGVDTGVVNAYNQTPYEILVDKIDYQRKFQYGTLTQEKTHHHIHRYVFCRRLMPPVIKSAMIKGVLCPQMYKRLHQSLFLFREHGRDAVNDYKPENWLSVPLMIHLPSEVTDKKMTKSFAHGFVDIISHISDILSTKEKQLPTASHIMKRCTMSDRTSYKFFLDNGGTIEHCLRCVIENCAMVSWEDGDGSEEEWRSYTKDIMDSNKFDRIDGFSGNFDYLRTFVLQYLMRA